jgi:epoxide hydrolase-like predicted phosphatase
MIKTIIFDIGGVVTHTDFPAIYSSFARRIGIAPEVVIEYHKTHLDDLLLGSITTEKFWQDMRDAGGNPKLNFEEIWVEEGLKNRHINEGMFPLIENLRKRYSVGTLTNLTASRLLIDKKTDLYSHFDYAVLSCDEHLKKPDPAFYRIALSRANVQPAEAVFIDDREEFIVSADRIGMKGIIYSYPNNDALIEKLKENGVVIDVREFSKQ